MDISKLIHSNEDTSFDQKPTTKAKTMTSKPYPCPVCNKSAFARRSDLVRHMRIHTNERPFVCHICGKSFIQRSALKVHWRTHSGERPHICEFRNCQKAFSDSSSLARHRRIHAGKQPYLCLAEGCHEHFAQKIALMNHHKVTHPGIPLPKHCIATLDGSAITTSASPKKRKHFQLQWRPLNQIVPGQQIPFVTSRIKQQMNHQPLVDNATIRFEIEKGKTASSTESDTFLGSLTCRTSTQSILSPTISSTSSSIISSSSTDTSLSFSSLSSLYSACPRLPLQSTYQQSPLLTMDMNSSAEKGCVSIRDINDTENNTMFAWRPSVPSFHSIYRSGTDITELTSSLKTVNTTTADTNPAVSVKFLPSIKTFLSTTI